MSTLQFLGAAGSVTGSSYLLTHHDTQFLVDCGFFQGDRVLEKHNYAAFHFDPKKIKFLILTHAHLDHCGLIPKLYKHGFRGEIYCTEPTFELTKLILSDAAQIQENGVTMEQIEALFVKRDATNSFRLFRIYPYGKIFSPLPGIKIRFQDAGHILGSSIVELWLDKKKVVFSGDIGNSPVPIMKDPTPIAEADYVLCESTYGDRLHPSVTARRQKLLEAAKTALKRNSKLIIPSFAMERSQDLLYELNALQNDNLLPPIQVFLDSPLAIKITDVYRQHTSYFDSEFQRQLRRDPDLFNFKNFRNISSAAESKTLNDLRGAAIYIAGSGMADAGRVQHHLLHHLSDPNVQVLFTGFQAPGTLGRKLTEGRKRVNVRGHNVSVRAEIKSVEAFSAHADQAGLLRWIGSFKTHPQVFLTHGEDASRQVLATKIQRQLKLIAHQPKFLQTVEL